MSASVEDTGEALRQVGFLCSVRRFADALELLDRVLAQDPTRSRAWCYRAQALLGTGDLASAVEAAGRAAVLGPDREWPQRLLSICYRQQGRHGEAVAAAGTAVRLAPHAWQAHVALAESLAATDPVSGYRAAVQAVELAPEVASCHRAVGALAFAAGWPLVAHQAFTRALELHPDDATTLNDLARLQLAHGQFSSDGIAQAMTGFSRAVGADPRLEVGRRNMAVTFEVLLLRIAALCMLDAAWALALGTRSPVARWTPLALLVFPVGFAARTMGRLTPALRRHCVLLMRRPGRAQLAGGLLTLSILALASSAALSPVPRAFCELLAFVAAVIPAVVLGAARRWVRRRPSPRGSPPRR